MSCMCEVSTNSKRRRSERGGRRHRAAQEARRKEREDQLGDAQGDHEDLGRAPGPRDAKDALPRYDNIITGIVHVI